MKQKYIEYFKDLYNYCSQHNTTSATVDLSTNRVYDSECIEYLVKVKYIELTKRYPRMAIIQITPLGIDFAENGFVEKSNSPVIQGDNSIYVNGINNTVSNNYNEFCTEISTSDLPDEYKELLETLLYELKNPKLSPDNRESKIKDFISKITNGVLSSVAIDTLMLLIKMLFSKISF